MNTKKFGMDYSAQNNFALFREVLENAQTILFTTHERTDGDDLGSVLAIANLLKNSGKDVSVVISGGIPEYLTYLPMSELVTEQLPEKNFDLLVVSGCSNIGRINHLQIQSLEIPIVNIDHHPDNQMFGDINIVDSSKSSVAELVYDMFIANQWVIDKNIAVCLLTGIVTDTGVLMHSNTQASTLKVAGKLMEKGASVPAIAQKTYGRKNPADLKAWGTALAKAKLDKHKGVIYSAIMEQDLEALGNPSMTAFEGVAETLNKVPESKYAMFIKQDGEMIKGSLRSENYKGVNVQEIAKSLGGGGHKLASGFSMYGKIDTNAEGELKII